MLNLRSGIKVERTIETLAAAIQSARNVLGAGGSGVEHFNRYLLWASDQERMLASIMSREDLDRLLMTRRYWSIQSMDPISYGPALTSFISLEVNARIEGFEEEIVLLRASYDVWNIEIQQSSFGDHLHAVVIDTNVLMNYRDHLDQVDWSELAGTARTQSIGVAVPQVVVSELDNLKHVNGKMIVDGVAHEKRWLATLALGWLEWQFPDTSSRTLLRAAAMTPAGPTPELYAILVDEPLSHSRLARADSEIIARALNLRGVAKTVTIASFDSNLIFTAKRLGLHAVKMPDYHEPPTDEAIAEEAT
ncbi:MAG: hypothetical protein JWQ39_2166 [Glaciihabitans sp.]|nr:hypothetical protein [Glaciihabitans sp.]